MLGARTVAILDILGFRKLIKAVGVSATANRYEQAISRTRYLMAPVRSDIDSGTRLLGDNYSSAPLCRRYVFSDTIILVSHDDKPESTLALLIYAWKLFQGLLASGLPSRGAVAHGDFYYNDNEHVFLGPALVEAYEVEQRQAWIGAALAPSVVPLLSPGLFARGTLLDFVFSSFPVPMKSGSTELLRTVNWRYNLVAEVGTRKLLSPDSAEAHPYVQPALEYARTMRCSAYPADPAGVPLELRGMWIGKLKPPFTHGDEF